MQSDAAHRRLDLVEIKIDKLEGMIRIEVQTLRDTVSPLKYQAKIITWVGVALGGSMITLVWMIILGQVQLVFP